MLNLYVRGYKSDSLAPTSLVTKELKLRPAIADKIEAAGWLERAQAYRECQRNVVVFRCPMNHSEKFPISCKQPFCEVCGSYQGRKTLNRYALIASKLVNLKMITLTLPPMEQIDPKTIRYWLAKVRYFLKFTLKYDGGVFVPELVRKEDKNAWFLHFHAVIAGRYINQKELSAKWEKATGAPVVWVSQVRNKAAAIKYVLKYLSKPPKGLEGLPVSTKAVALSTLMLSFFDVKKVRLFGCFVGALIIQKSVKFVLLCDECADHAEMKWDGIEHGTPIT